jgi:uncharacterized membrane protein YecN with MAPEG domain
VLATRLGRHDRTRSLLLGGAGVAVALLIWWVLVVLLPGDGARANQASRIALGAASLLPAAGVLLAMLLVQMAARFIAGTFDPTLGRDSRLLVVNQRVITNTVEQMACFVPAMLALSVATRPDRMGMVVALGLTFALARIAFWIGYLTAPLFRAPGMAATFVLNVMAFAGAVWAWLG